MAVDINKKHKENLSITDRIVLEVTKGVGSFWCAVIFACMAFYGFPGFKDSHALVLWLSSEFFQLVLLSVILKSESLSSRHSEHLADATYRHQLFIESKLNNILESLKK